MCGLAGAAGAIGDDVIAAVGSMSHAQAHRGPDGDGQWTSVSSDGFGISLAHRRLAVIDLSNGGAQPMHNAETGDVVVFNGEIYNFAALRAELEAAGARFASSSDTEVILRAYQAWGLDAVRRFRGIFAFALWDARRQALHLVRDPMGVKPLYWTVRNRTVYFASELRALLAAGIERRLSPSAVASFLWHGFVVGPQTIVDGVEVLPPASYLTITAGNLRPTPQQYWRLPPASEGKASTASVAHTLQETIRMQLVSDVPLGVFLSGGVDSTVIAALACETRAAEIRTFNIGFEQPDLDESRHATEVARVLGTRHVSLRLGEADFRRQLPKALDAIDQPTFDGINTYLLSRAVRDAGMTVALAGTGGDELFGGYRSFVDLPRATRLSRAAGALSGALQGLAGLATSAALGLGVVPPQTRWGKLADVVSSGGALIDLYQAEYGLFSSVLFGRLRAGRAALAPVASGLTAEQRATYAAALSDASSLHDISSLELSSFIRERLVRDQDAASMAVALEMRVPFLDHVVIEEIAGLPTHERFMPLGRKNLLRQLVMARIDPQTFDRPKSGFVLPVDDWCRRGMREQMDDLYHDKDLCERAGIDGRTAVALWRSFLGGGPGLYWSRVWAIFVLLDWCRRHRVSL
jgi:asparagine synthase (glutamine-hydrolysing)